MVLKDSGGLVKLYALVNVEKYSIVATGSTQTEAKEKYINRLVEEGVIVETEELPEEDSVQSEKIDVKSVSIATVNGESVVYIRAENGNLYKQSVAADESVMLIEKGHMIYVTYVETEIDGIKQIIKWQFWFDQGEGAK